MQHLIRKRVEGNRINFKCNSLTLIRYIAAAQVLVGHVSAHLNLQFGGVFVRILGFFPGVPIFFGISGFLIWHSLENEASFKTYLEKRFMRIYPELWMSIFISFVSILILYSEHINFFKMFLFAFTQGTILQFWTPEFLRGYGVGTPNGSLWTIGILVQFYIIMFFLHKFLRGRGRKFWPVLLSFSIILNVVDPFVGGYSPTRSCISSMNKRFFRISICS